MEVGDEETDIITLETQADTHKMRGVRVCVCVFVCERESRCNGDQVPSLNRAKPHAGPPNCIVNRLRHVMIHGTETVLQAIIQLLPNYFINDEQGTWSPLH